MARTDSRQWIKEFLRSENEKNNYSSDYCDCGKLATGEWRTLYLFPLCRVW